VLTTGSALPAACPVGAVWKCNRPPDLEHGGRLNTRECESVVHDETGTGPAAALVIRVWRDAAGGHAIKARITERPDLDTDDVLTTTVSTPEEVYGEVRHWLERFIASSLPGGLS
jgi:hypothetical protein